METSISLCLLTAHFCYASNWSSPRKSAQDEQRNDFQIMCFFEIMGLLHLVQNYNNGGG